MLDLTWDYRASWKLIGIELGIDTGTLNAINLNNKMVEDCLVGMIDHWLRNEKPRPTRDAITMALQSKCVSSVVGNSVITLAYITYGILLSMSKC